MRSLFLLGAIALAPFSASAALINFDSTPAGVYTSLAIGSVTITFTGGSGSFNVDSNPPNDGFADGRSLISYFQNPGPDAFVASFGAPVNAVSISVTDFVPSDDDDVHLEAYSASNVLLSSDAFLIPGSGPGHVLSVSSASPIAYVKFYEVGSFAGAVYWDNLNYASRDSQVPEPGTFLFAGAGLAGLVFFRRRR